MKNIYISHKLSTYYTRVLLVKLATRYSKLATKI